MATIGIMVVQFFNIPEGLKSKAFLVLYGVYFMWYVGIMSDFYITWEGNWKVIRAEKDKQKMIFIEFVHSGTLLPPYLLTAIFFSHKRINQSILLT